jgi:hypothetical protein
VAKKSFKSSPGGRSSHSAKRPKKNPGKKMHARRNPPKGMTGLFEQGGFAIAGAAGSKYLAQMILGTSNTGFVGYAANLGIGFVLSKAVEMFTKNPLYANAVILGAVIQTMTRALLDNTTIGSTLGLSGVGDYVAQATTIPPTLVPGTRFVTADPFARAHAAAIAAATAPPPGTSPTQAKLGAYGRMGRSMITGGR